MRWDLSFGTLLDLAEACDVPAGFGCRTGVCHACQSGLVSGEVHYQFEPLELGAAHHQDPLLDRRKSNEFQRGRLGCLLCHNPQPAKRSGPSGDAALLFIGEAGE
ncbi:MAG: 2Fe-2S iron-sulfur cluster binding domain-containing protein [Solirubrobacterales bacterium]|nr:2Fe-2S iron-sulfur cluster binding domain-containing protein [Solirubrobacterales bacterium]